MHNRKILFIFKKIIININNISRIKLFIKKKKSKFLINYQCYLIKFRKQL